MRAVKAAMGPPFALTKQMNNAFKEFVRASGNLTAEEQYNYILYLYERQRLTYIIHIDVYFISLDINLEHLY